MNDLFYGFLVFFAFVSLVGGLNWLMTAINSWGNRSESTEDLLQHQFKMPVDVANVVYIVVFVCALALFLMVAFPQNLKKAFSGVSGGMRRVM
jgi:L-asparagine transporter-like permease